MDTYKELSERYRNDKAVRFKSLEAFNHFDSMDVVKALRDIENIKYILECKLEKLEKGE